MTDPSPVDSVLAFWHGEEERAAMLAHVRTLDATRARFGDLERPLPDRITAGLSARGIDRLYLHQVRAIDRIRRGTSTVIVAGTASGKSLCYQVPIAEAAVDDGRATALAIYPTKALSQDQIPGFGKLGAALVAATYDGDTPRDDRRWIRDNASVVLTNPDMLHVGILPNHSRWSSFLSRLRYVVVDELHVLRGVFGSHTAHVLRRLRRLAAHYGADPTFVFTSATIGNPGDLARELAGIPVEVVDEDMSPSGEKVWVIWNPPDPEGGDEGDELARASSLAEATDVVVDLIRHDVPTIAFARSRRATELMYRWARDRLDDDRRSRIAPYRGGYLPGDRRAIERRLFDGELLGVVATNALELGIDVGGLDAAVITTFPGTLASLRQQAGRAGRGRARAVVILVAGRDALDQYYVAHPDLLFSRPSEAAVVNPQNPEILTAQLGCAAYELPLVPDDRTFFGEEIEEAAPGMVQSGALRLRDGRLFWSKRRPPAPDINIRTSGGPTYTIYDRAEREQLGTIEEHRAYSQAHPGAVYLHQGSTFLVEDLDRARHEIRVVSGSVDYYTQPKEEKHLDVLAVDGRRRVGRFEARLGRVEVETHVVAFRRKSIRGGAIIDTEPLDLPPLTFRTQAFWFVIPDALYAEADVAWADVPGTLHAIEHTAIAMMPLFTICDRWDVGGLSTPAHPQESGGVFFIYDGYPGGAGISPIAFQSAERHLRATLDALRRCPCTDGCPACVQSPKCGNFNEPLDKHGAARLLEVGLG